MYFFLGGFMVFEYNDKSYSIEIIRKNNKNIYIRVKNNKIIVTCSYFTTNKQIDKLIKDNYDSIVKMIDRDEQRIEKESKFYLFGNVYDIVYGFNELEINNNKIYVSNEKELNKYLNNKIKEVFSERLNYWYNIFEEKIPVPNLKIRKMTSRWGVCNLKNKNITLNYSLYKYDISCLDYVIIHELSHFIHPNHSKDFWNLVSKYCSNYKELRKKLKD